jgi:alpha-D-ribose 1-methylphosphonate 5-triphosphate synthase subunit PhnL
MSKLLISIRGLAKSFTLHNRGGAMLSVLDALDLDLWSGECLVLTGPSGAGKSSLLRCIYGNYKPTSGSITVQHGNDLVDLTNAHHRLVMDIRRRTLGYVSQFLRVVPRVPTLDVVAEPLVRSGWALAAARDRAAELLTHLAVPERLWPLPPQTFSGGEQQRVNIARGFAVDFPVYLLDEPTSALDPENRRRVATLIGQARQRGAGIIGIFHDHDFAAAVETRRFALEPAARAAA